MKKVVKSKKPIAKVAKAPVKKVVAKVAKAPKNNKKSFSWWKILIVVIIVGLAGLFGAKYYYIQSHDWNYFFEKGFASAQEGKYCKAVKFFGIASQKLEKTDPIYTIALARKAETLVIMGKYEKALKVYSKAVLAQNNSEDPLAWIFTAYADTLEAYRNTNPSAEKLAKVSEKVNETLSKVSPQIMALKETNTNIRSADVETAVLRIKGILAE